MGGRGGRHAGRRRRKYGNQRHPVPPRPFRIFTGRRDDHGRRWISRGVAVWGKRHALARVEARGRAAHGAHVHLGVNAVERLIRALGEVFALREMPVHIPSDVDEVIRAASTVSEAISGNGETHTLRHVTVNCGLFRGGTLPNVMPDEANAALDIRLPAGTTRQT